MIHDGRMREGDVLPATRVLAESLGVARGTVVAAYEQLDGEGYITVRHGAAARVAATVASTTQRDGRHDRIAARDGAHPSIRPAAAPQRQAAGDEPRAALDLSPGVPSVSSISARDWRAAWRHAASQPLLEAYPPQLGESELRAQFAAQLAFSRGAAVAPDRVVVTAGTSEAISLVTEALERPVVAVENPGYRAGRRAITGAGGHVVGVGVDERGLRLEELRRAHERGRIDAVMVTPSHQYPLGGIMPVARRRELLDWAAAERVLVIEDDYDSEFRHRGDPLPALAAIDDAGVVAHIGSLSKVLSPQLRCGYVTLPEGLPDVASAIARTRLARGAAVATPVQQAAAWLMASGALRRHIARVRRDYSHKRALVAAALSGLPGVAVGGLDGGLHAVVEFEPPASALLARLREQGIVVASLDDYVVEGSRLAANGIVFGYGAVSATALAGALATIAAALAAPPTR